MVLERLLRPSFLFRRPVGRVADGEVPGEHVQQRLGGDVGAHQHLAGACSGRLETDGFGRVTRACFRRMGAHRLSLGVPGSNTWWETLVGSSWNFHPVGEPERMALFGSGGWVNQSLEWVKVAESGCGEYRCFVESTGFWMS